MASASLGVQAQEAGSASLAPDEDGLAVSAHIGTQLALVVIFPLPGVSVDVIVDSDRLPVWGQVQLAAHIPLAVGSVRLGVGGRQGAGGYALCEKGVGLGHHDFGDYHLTGCGLGGRLARDRTTFSLDATVGRSTDRTFGAYAKLNFAAHYRLGRFP